MGFPAVLYNREQAQGRNLEISLWGQELHAPPDQQHVEVGMVQQYSMKEVKELFGDKANPVIGINGDVPLMLKSKFGQQPAHVHCGM